MMSRFRRLIARLEAFARPGARDEDLQREIETHIALLADDNIRRGMSRAEAERAARLRVGNLASLAARHRDERGMPAIESLWQDLRFALRLFAKERWFSTAAVATLAIGIGANAAGFSIVSAAFLRGLPLPESHDIHELSWQTTGDGRASLSYADVVDWQAAQTIDVAALDDVRMNVSDDAAMADQVSGAWVSANLFGVLRQPVLIGRDLVVGEDAPGANPVVILGHRLWTSRYNADLSVLGKTLRLNGQPATIVGVMPEGMRFPETADLWAPLVVRPEDRHSTMVSGIGRVRNSASSRVVQTELRQITQQLASMHPRRSFEIDDVAVEPFGVGGYARTMFLTVIVAVGFVLLIACANVANLLLSRSAYRVREVALRIAVGATRARVVRQLLIEGLVLAALGGAAGLLLADLGLDALERALVAVDKPYWLTLTVDRTVLAYVALLCLGVTLLVGLAPALHLSAARSHDVLKEGGRGLTLSRGLRGFSTAMVVMQLALTFILLAGAGFLVRSFTTLSTVDLGMATDRLLAMKVDLSEGRYPTPESRWRVLERIGGRVQTLPGIEAAALTTGVPPADGGERLMEVESTGAPVESRFVSTVAISPSFFSVAGRPPLRGREFDDRDGAPGTDGVIVNERLAALFFAGDDPIGRRLRFTSRHGAAVEPEPWRTIVGVSASIRHGSPSDAYLNAVVYTPLRGDAAVSVSLLIRSAIAPELVMEAVRREVRAEDPDQPVYGLRTLEQLLDADRWPYRIFGTLFAILAVASLVMSAVGLYAVMAYAVARRTHEIGVRMAVGADRRRIWWLVVKRGLSQLAVGLPIGIGGAALLGTALQRMLVNMSPTDPLIMLAVLAVLTLAALVACVVPALRASRVDPMTALRFD